MFSQQRKRVDSQRWAPAEEDVTEGDLGLGEIAHLDICTGTAVCYRDGDTVSGRNMDTQEGGGRQLRMKLASTFAPVHCLLCCSGLTVMI